MLLDFKAYTDSELKLMNKIRTYNWEGLKRLWLKVQKHNTPGWEAGKALEYMIIRAFDLEGVEVAYPYSNKVINAQEQFDGYVFIKDLGVGFIFECKDWAKNVAFDELAKVHGRLTYRTPTTFGVFVSRNGFTPSATELMYMMHPHNVLLWSFEDIEECFKHHKFVKALKYKYQYAMMTANPNIAVIDGLNI